MASNALSMDGFFIYSLVRDVCEVSLGALRIRNSWLTTALQGLCFLHGSVIGWHGNLRSTNCLINDRWQVKLSEYGIKCFREHEKREAKGKRVLSGLEQMGFCLDMLWTAPEHIRENDFVGSKHGDIFSFAIVCSELVNMRPAWENVDDTKGNPEGTC